MCQLCSYLRYQSLVSISISFLSSLITNQPLRSIQSNSILIIKLAISGHLRVSCLFLLKGLLSCLPTTIITSECECACMHMPRLTMVPCVPRTCPDVEPCCGTVSNACHYSVRGACACRRFHGSAKFSSYYITVDHRPRIKNDEWMLFLHGTTEPYPRTVVVTGQIVFHGTWNHVEPNGTGLDCAKQVVASI